MQVNTVSSTVPTSKRKMETTPSTSSKRKMAHEQDLSGLSFSKMKITDTGRKMVYVNMNNSTFQIESPWLKSFFGIRPPPAEYADQTKPKYSIQLSLDDNNGIDTEVKEFTEFMKCFEKRLIKEGVRNRMDWFKKSTLSEEIIEQAMMTKIVKPCIDKETGEESNMYPPSMSATIPYYDGDWNCMIFDEKCQLVTDDIDKLVTGRMKVRVIMECCPMWFIGTNKYGCKWKVKQMQYVPLSDSSMSFEKYAFDTIIPRSIKDVSSLTFTEMKVSEKNGAKNVYINTSDGGPILLQTPWMNSYRGISLPPPEFADPDKPKYSVNWSVDGFDNEDSEGGAFYQTLQSLDERILEEAKNNPMKWFHKKNVSVDVLKSAMFSPQVKFRTDKETGEEMTQFPPTFKASVPYYDRQWKCVVFDEDQIKHTENLDEISGGQRMQMRAILQCKTIWFVGGRFGCSWKITQLEFKKSNSSSNAIMSFRQESKKTKMIQDFPDMKDGKKKNTDEVVSEKETDEVDECVDSDFE